MEVIIADFSGFCFGVERAIGIVESVATENVAVTYGPIIHNPQVVKSLEKKGVKAVEPGEAIPEGAALVIRSHGVERSEAEKLRKGTNKIVDATCPFVQKAQSMAAKLSAECDTVVILGEADHPEVKGIVSYVQGEYFIVNGPAEAEKLPVRKCYGFLAQTTQNNEIFIKISDILRLKCEELKVAKTICNATDRRQKASTALAAEVEVMIVIGGKNSANTTRLYHLCKEICERTYHVETEAELSKEMFRGVSKVGLTAGASTPGGLVAKVREYILEVSR